MQVSSLDCKKIGKTGKIFPIYSVYDKFKSKAHTLFINFDLKKNIP